MFWTEVSLKLIKIEDNERIIATVRNINDRKRAEEKIFNLLEFAPMAFFHGDTFGNFIKVNNKAVKLTGYSREELLSMNMKDLFSETFLKAKPLLYSNLNEGEVLKKERKLKQKKGQEIVVDMISKAMSDETYQSFMTDITERVETSKKIKESNTFLINTLESMTDAYVSLDENWMYTYVNKNAGKLFGRKPKDLIGKHIWTEFPEGINQPFYKNYYRAVETQTPIIMEDYYPPWDKWYENRIIPSKNGLAIFFHDITENKKAQLALKELTERLEVLHYLDRSILNNKALKNIAEDVFIVLKKNISFDFISLTKYNKENQSFTQLLTNKYDLEIMEHPLNHTFPSTEFDVIDFDLMLQGKHQIITALKKQKTNSPIVKNLISENIKSLFVIPLFLEDSLMGSLTLASKNNDTFQSSKNIDVCTEIANQLAIALNKENLQNEIKSHTKNLEQKIEERTKSLTEANEELKAFTYSVSHDLKAPLRAISQLSYWLSQDYADKIDEQGQKQLSLLIGRAKRLDNLIEGLLQYSRAGKTREKEKELNLNSFVNEIIELLNPMLNITIIIKNKLPNFIGDPIRLGQLFQNLIDNAIKYNDKPSIIINIGSKKVNDFWEFYVEDNGPGIAEKYFERIFQIFQRLEARDSLEGTGIGLSLAKRIVQIYGGKIWLTSKIGIGTTFYFTLPIHKTS